MNLKVFYEDNHIIVVEKKANIPSQEDNSQDISVLTMVKQYIKEKYQKLGNVYIGLVQRLDRPVGGVMVFARTSKAAARLSDQIRNNQFTKKYYAVVHGKLDTTGTLENYLVKDENTNTSRIADSSVKDAKKAILDYQVLKYDAKQNLSLLDINLHTGRHHQIRVQLAGINHPIYGDQRYGLPNEKGIQIYLWAHQVTFQHPVKDEKLTFESQPNWTIFK